MKFYSSSLELSNLQTHIIVYRLGCRSRVSIRTFDFDISCTFTKKLGSPDTAELNQLYHAKNENSNYRSNFAMSGLPNFRYFS